RQVDQSRLELPSRPARSVGRYGHVMRFPGTKHLPHRLDSSPCCRAPNQAKAKMPANVGNDLTIGILADEDTDFWPSVMVSQEQHVLMPEYINVAFIFALKVRPHILAKGAILVAECSDP